MPLRHRLTAAAAALTLCLGSALLLAPGPAGAESSLKQPPAGANDWDCEPTQRHPRPVVLVHGLSATMDANWSYLSPLLKERGYCVFALTYGLDPRIAAFGAPGGVIKIQKSARELKRFIARVRGATGARRVDLVGHSEGTFMPQYYLKFLNGAPKVKRYVAFTPLYDGTNLAGAASLAAAGEAFGISEPLVDLVGSLCGSCPQFLNGSTMQRKLARGGARVKGVEYTTVITKLDELVVPYTSGILEGAKDNFILQDLCPNNLSEHALVAFDPVAAQLTFNALDPKRARPVDCDRIPS